jgi:hypothetical protein
VFVVRYRAEDRKDKFRAPSIAAQRPSAPRRLRGCDGHADGVDYLIAAADHIVRRFSWRDVQFLHMGTGPEYDALVTQRPARSSRVCRSSRSRHERVPVYGAQHD